MKTIEYRWIDKTNWPRGPWDNEPDKIQWQDTATGLPCMVRRNEHSGNWCGYVGVPEVHPAFQRDYSDVPCEVHGGLTYADFCSPGGEHEICHVVEAGENDRVWWLGFDAGHCWDLSPAIQARLLGVGDDDAFEHCQYRDLAYMQEECANLAGQLAALSLQEEK